MTPLPVWVGTAVLAVATGAVVDASRRVATRLFPSDLLAAFAAAAVLCGAAIVVLLEALGVAGLLTWWAPAAEAALLWLGVRWVLGSPPASWHVELRPLRTWSRPALVAGGAAACLAIPLAAQLLAALVRPHPTFDTQAGHLNTVVDWLQAGNLRLLPYASPVAAQPRYPADSELQGLWFVLPLHRDLFVQAANVLWVVMLASGAALAVRELGGRVSGQVAAALAVPAVPLVLWPLVGTNMTDLLQTAGLAAACGFCALGARLRPRACCVLGGLAAGMVVGSRYAGAIALAPLALVVAATAAGRIPRPARAAVVRGAVLIGGATVLTGAYWYVRNWVQTGDPIYPQSVPWRHVDSPELDPFRLFASYAQLGFDPHAWRVLAGEIWARGGPVLAILVAGVVVPPIAASRRRERRWAAWAWALLPALELLGFMATPLGAGYLIDHQPVAAGADLNLRYLLPTMITSAVVLAAELGRLTAARADLAAAATVALGLVGLATVGPVAEIDKPGAPMVVAAIAGVAVLVLAVEARASSRRARPLSPLRTAALGVAAVAVVAAASPLVLRYHDDRRSLLQFNGADALLPATATVDVAGFCELYALHGADLERRVTYLTGDDGSVSRRVITSYDAWLASLRDHGITDVVTGSDICFPASRVPQLDWMTAHPDVFGKAATGDGLVVWRVAPGR